MLPAEGLRLLPLLGDVLGDEQEHRGECETAGEEDDAVLPVRDVLDPAVEEQPDDARGDGRHDEDEERFEGLFEEVENIPPQNRDNGDEGADVQHDVEKEGIAAEVRPQNAVQERQMSA